MTHERLAVRGFFGEWRFLSNFHPCFVEVRAPVCGKVMIATSVEHAYQASKAARDEDFFAVLDCSTPAAAKKRGREIKKPRADWDKDAVMLELLRKKFSREPLRGQLLATRGRELIEANNWNDTYWGVHNGVGRNRLGELLMQVRREGLQRAV